MDKSSDLFQSASKSESRQAVEKIMRGYKNLYYCGTEVAPTDVPYKCVDCNILFERDEYNNHRNQAHQQSLFFSNKLQSGKKVKKNRNRPAAQNPYKYKQPLLETQSVVVQNPGIRPTSPLFKFWLKEEFEKLEAQKNALKPEQSEQEKKEAEEFADSCLI